MTRLTADERGPELSTLGRSGLDYQLCYNLKSVESSTGQHIVTVESTKDQPWPWSIRQTAAHHQFDVDSGRAGWIIVKGNKLMQTRMKSEMESRMRQHSSTPDRDTEAVENFASTLAMHLVLCKWSCERWRWYINYLEEDFDRVTRRIVSAEVSALPPPPSHTPAPKVRKSARKRGIRLFLPSLRKTSITAYNMITMPANTNRHPSVALSEPEDPPELPPDLPPARREATIDNGGHNFTFGDLQRTQYLEERANETVLVLKSNLGVLAYLREYYTTLLDNEPFLNKRLKHEYQSAISRFEKMVKQVESELLMHQSRVESFSHVVENRKNLVRMTLSAINR